MFSIFLPPKKDTEKIECIVRNFLWDDGERKKKYHLINWKVCRKSTKLESGLSIKLYKGLNMSLIKKWW